MGPAGSAGAPLPPPRPALPPPPRPSCGAAGAPSCPASGATKATVVPTTRANPNNRLFIEAYSPAGSLAESQVLTLKFHQPGSGAGLLNHGHCDPPILSERHRIADGGFVKQCVRPRARES